MNRALFLDRDGIINIEKNYVHEISDFEFVEGIFETLRYFQDRGYLIIIITNQAGIGRGYYTEEDFNVLNEWMIKQFEDNSILLTKVYYCPYHPEHGIGYYKQDSFYRKPNPGMILEAQKEFNIDLSSSIVVGDNDTDIMAGVNAGVKFNILVKAELQNNFTTEANCIVKNIRELANWPIPD